MAITDLTGYTWVGDSSMSIRIDASETYHINFTCDNVNYTSFSLYDEFSEAGVGYDDDWVAYGLQSNVQWYNEKYRTIYITGGSDVTNGNLISWLQDLGTLSLPAPKIDFDLTTLSLSEGTHNLKVKATATGYRDSEFSNVVQYTVAPSGPAIGDIITLNGETRHYRVIGKVGNNYKLLDMDNTTTSEFNYPSVITTFSNGANGQKYQYSKLDTAMTTYYNNLSTAIKNAIVDTNINQNLYRYYSTPDTKGATTYTYQNQYDWSRDWENANYEGYVNVGNRKCFALDLPDIYEYMAVKGSDGNRLASSSDLMKMFFGGTGEKGEHSGKSVWLRSARSGYSDNAWVVSLSNGRFNHSGYSSNYAVRPAFVINLSGITWSVAN